MFPERGTWESNGQLRGINYALPNRGMDDLRYDLGRTSVAATDGIGDSATATQKVGGIGRRIDLHG